MTKVLLLFIDCDSSQFIYEKPVHQIIQKVLNFLNKKLKWNIERGVWNCFIFSGSIIILNWHSWVAWTTIATINLTFRLW